jgi:N-acetylmuramoyl-L-alanine amidase
MKRLIFLALPLLMLGVLSGQVLAAGSSLAGHRIILDPGHGGTDPGSTACPGLYEKNANLDIAFRLKNLLTADGATVYMTRTADTTVSNAQRYNYANSTNGEVLLSIHLNGSTDPSVDGTIGLWGKRNKDLKFTQAMHAGLPSALSVPDQGVSNFASGVLLKSNVPASIQESVYISNAGECARLTDGTGARQQQVAQALHDALAAWFSQ